MLWPEADQKFLVLVGILRLLVSWRCATGLSVVAIASPPSQALTVAAAVGCVPVTFLRDTVVYEWKGVGDLRRELEELLVRC